MTEKRDCECGKSPKGFCICYPANDNDAEGFIRLPSADSLAMPATYHRLAITYANLVPIGRRLIVDWLCDVVWNYDGIIIDADGCRIDPSNIEPDDVLRTECDGSLRWLSDFLKFAERPPHQAAQEKVIPRLELLYLAIAIQYPSIAKRIVAG